MRLLPLFFFFTLISFGQTTKRLDQNKDSILYYLNNARDNVKSRYLKRAFELSESIEHDSLLKKSSIELGFDFYSKRDVDGLYKVNKTLFYLFSKNQDSSSLAKHYHFKALIFRIQTRLDSSFYYYNQSKNVSIKIRDSVEAGGRCLNMSYLQKNGNDFVGAEATVIEGLKYLEPLKEFKYTPDSYISLGHILSRTNKHKEAIEYYEKSLVSNENNPSELVRERWPLLIANNIGYTYLIQDRPKEAIPYFRKALNHDSIAKKFPYEYQLLLGNYSDANYLLGNTKEAWRDFWKLLRFREKNNNIFGQGVSHNGFAYYYMLEGNDKKALYHARKSYELTNRVNNNFTRSSVLIKLANLTSGDESKKYMNEYIALNDSLRNVELNLKSDFTKIRYETEKKEQENAALKLEKEKTRIEKERAEQQRTIALLISIALLLTLGLSVTSYRNRRKKLLYKSQLEKANAREHERQQIAKSLHDEVAGDLRVLHQKLVGNQQQEEAAGLEKIKDNVRNLSHQLSSVSFEDVSFKDQMINLATDYFTKDFKVFVKGLEDEAWSEVNETIKRTLYLSVRESVQNALRHSNASRFDIHFAMHKKEVSVSAKDNGQGFDSEKSAKGIGLKNMEERVQELRGTVDINSSEKGTEIQIIIPRNGR